MFFQGMLNSIGIGSTLYMILTGFLCCHKTVGKQFYYSGIKVLLSYIFFSLLTIVVDIYLFNTGMTWKNGILGIFSFSTIHYAWYIEMWIGLFILAPFLTIWYNALLSRKMKFGLITIILMMSALPDFFNRYGMDIIPDYWENLYPLGYYFCGAFIREYRPCISKWKLLAIFIAITMISPITTLISGHSTFIRIIGDRNGIFCAIMTLCIFLMFYSVDLKSRFWMVIFRSISLRSLDIFLCSATIDLYIYPLFIKNYYISQPQFGIFYFVIVPIVFMVCYFLASVKRVIFAWIDQILQLYKVPFRIQNRA